MRLHIGGEITKDGWKILNISEKPGVDYIGDISDLSMFQDGSASDVYASHVFEHVKQAKALDTLKEIKRILKPGGKFYVSVPDLDVLCHTFINPIVSPAVKFHVMRMMFGGQMDAYDFHFFGWNQAFLFDFLFTGIYNNTMMQNILFTLPSILSLNNDLYAYEREDSGGLC